MRFFIKIPEDEELVHIASRKAELMEGIIKNYPDLTIQGLDNDDLNGVPTAELGAFLAFGQGDCDISCINKENQATIPIHANIYTLGKDDIIIDASIFRYNQQKQTSEIFALIN